MELWGFKLRGSGYPQNFHRPLAAKLCVKPPKRFRGERTCSRSSITVPSLEGVGFHPPPGWLKRWVFCLSACLSVCSFVTLLNVRPCAPDFAMKALEHRNEFDALDRGRCVVVHPCLTFSDCGQLPTPLNAEVQKNGKICSPPEGDRINRSRRNLTRKRILRVCASALNLALIGKRTK